MGSAGARADSVDFKLLSGGLLTMGGGVADGATAGAQTLPSVVTLTDGSFLLAWTDTTGGDADVRVRHFSASGAALDASYLGGRVSAGEQSTPALTALSDGQAALVFQDASHASLGGQGSDAVAHAVAFQTLLGSGSSADAAAENPIIAGTSGDDVLNGGSTDDYFLGGAGVDTLTGGAGNDIYDIRNGADRIVETPGEGTDTVYAHVSYTLPANVENLVIVDGAHTAAGNADANTLIGDDADNVFFGLGGADLMIGGKGDDVYEVTEAGDVVTENAGEGTDAVFSYVDGYVLPANVETLVLKGADHHAVGNSAANTLIGTPENDVFFGGGGGDLMIGGAGDDTYEVKSGADVISEKPGEGTDGVFSYLSAYQLPANVETLVLVGSAVTGLGNSQANTLIGNELVNVLNGNGGDDVLTGGAGVDVFWWLGADAGRDRITDFDAANEHIVVSSRVFADYAAVQAAETQVGADVVITLSAATTLTIQNVTLAQLSSNNFVFYSGAFANGGPDGMSEIALVGAAAAA